MVSSKVNSNSVELTETENELYDRQIRLWGLESQKKLRGAKVLISGLNGIGAEVTKNLILSGVNSVTLRDEKLVKEDDFISQFLLPKSSLGLNRAVASVDRAKQLNPMVQISTDTEELEQKVDSYFKTFDVVVIFGAPSSELLRINNICRKENIKFFSADIWGWIGYYFADLQTHTFIEDVVKYKTTTRPNGVTKSEIVTCPTKREVNFPALSAVFEYDFNSSNYLKKIKHSGPAFIVVRILQMFREKFNRDPTYSTRENDILELEKIRNEVSSEKIVPSIFFSHVFSEISPAAAVIGGALAQEIIKTITEKEQPHRSMFIFDPETCRGFVESFDLK